MERNKHIMKSFSIILAILACLSVSDIIAQDSKLELIISVENTSTKKAEDGKIIVVVEGEKNNYTFHLLDKLPWEGGVEISNSGLISGTEYEFTNLVVGKYLVCVSEKKGKSECEYAQIRKE